MDPITLAIVGALASLSQTAIKDAYQGIKALIQKKYGSDSKAAKAVNDLEANPKSEGRKAVLNEELVSAGAGKDVELAAQAQNLLRLLKDLPATSVTVEQSVKGDKNIFSGTGNVTVKK